MVAIRIKRVYEPPAEADGMRVLVDRLWPRGLSRQAAHLDTWLKEIAPSDELRRFFGHDPDKWPEFRKRYLHELAHNPHLDELRSMLRSGGFVTLLYAAKDAAHNNAVVLREMLMRDEGS
jgi:uncharacterized protein YeaO (DUF488 family)